MPGSRTLYVLRHAKSSWDDPGIDDHDRPLAPRGRRAAVALAAHVKQTGIAPQLVLCSSAQRTRETLEGVAPPGQWQVEPQLYGASASTLLERLHQLHDEVESAMLIGHNPAMQVLVLRLASAVAGVAEQSHLDQIQRKFPTGALATLNFECAWDALAPGRARLTAYVRPKQL